MFFRTTPDPFVRSNHDITRRFFGTEQTVLNIKLPKDMNFSNFYEPIFKKKTQKSISFPLQEIFWDFINAFFGETSPFPAQ